MPRPSKTLSGERLHELARAGAEIVIKQLRAEITAIERVFPQLAVPQTRRAGRRSLTKVVRRTSRMSSAARKAVSARMKKYWAERRKAKATARK